MRAPPPRPSRLLSHARGTKTIIKNIWSTAAWGQSVQNIRDLCCAVRAHPHRLLHPRTTYGFSVIFIRRTYLYAAVSEWRTRTAVESFSATVVYLSARTNPSIPLYARTSCVLFWHNIIFKTNQRVCGLVVEGGEGERQWCLPPSAKWHCARPGSGAPFGVKSFLLYYG